MKFEQLKKRVIRLEKWQKETIGKIAEFQKNIDENNKLMEKISKRIKTFNLRTTNLKKEFDKSREEINKKFNNNEELSKRFDIYILRNIKSLTKASIIIDEILKDIEFLTISTKINAKDIFDYKKSIESSLVKRTLLFVKSKTNTLVRSFKKG